MDEQRRAEEGQIAEWKIEAGHLEAEARRLADAGDGDRAEEERARAVELRRKVRALAGVAPVSIREAAEELKRLRYSAGGPPLVAPFPGGRGPAPDPEPGLPSPALAPRDGYPAHRPDWSGLVAALGAGLVAGDFAVLVAHTGAGKSAFALQLAGETARGGRPALVISLELEPGQIAARRLAQRAPVPSRDGEGPNYPPSWRAVWMGKAEGIDLNRAIEAMASEEPGLFTWRPTSAELDAFETELADRLRWLWRETGRPPLVVLDYLQRLASGDGIREAIRDKSRALRSLSMAGDEGHPLGAGWPGAAVLALSTSARSNYAYLRPGAMLDPIADPDWFVGLGKESGEIEGDASHVVALAVERAQSFPSGPAGAEEAPALMAIGKSRYGILSRGPRGWLLGWRFEGAAGRWRTDPGALDSCAQIEAERDEARKARKGKGRASGDDHDNPAPTGGARSNHLDLIP